MSTPLSIRIKLERALVAYVNSRALPGTRLHSLTVVPGHTGVEPALPYLVCYVGQAPAHPDMPAELGIRSAQPVFHLKTSANDEERETTDARLEELDSILLEPLNPAAPWSDENKAAGRLLKFLNKPASGGDPRATDLRKFHAYDFYPADDSSSGGGDVWHDQRSFVCVCQPYDGS